MELEYFMARDAAKKEKGAGLDACSSTIDVSSVSFSKLDLDF
jgi:hypothetical protein